MPYPILPEEYDAYRELATARYHLAQKLHRLGFHAEAESNQEIARDYTQKAAENRPNRGK